LSNLVFINHNQLEGGDTGHDTVSKSNKYEAEMVCVIVKYLLDQGYPCSKIVVLTPYLGQLLVLRQDLQKFVDVSLGERDVDAVLDLGEPDLNAEDLESKDRNVRISTIDNYQGEESEIIIVSTVRSNEQGSVGFLGEPERVNVMLSRAKHGLLILGNMETLINAKSAKAKKLWVSVNESLVEQKAIYDGFPAYCVQHDKKNIIADPKQFPRFGGCDEVCGQVMECGHHCNMLCHTSIAKCTECGPCDEERLKQEAFGREKKRLEEEMSELSLQEVLIAAVKAPQAG
jgi:hypothetical protein